MANDNILCYNKLVICHNNACLVQFLQIHQSLLGKRIWKSLVMPQMQHRFQWLVQNWIYTSVKKVIYMQFYTILLDTVNLQELILGIKIQDERQDHQEVLEKRKTFTSCEPQLNLWQMCQQVICLECSRKVCSVCIVKFRRK